MFRGKSLILLSENNKSFSRESADISVKTLGVLVKTSTVSAESVLFSISEDKEFALECRFWKQSKLLFSPVLHLFVSKTSFISSSCSLQRREKKEGIALPFADNLT